jgi:hypothetical protein
MRIDLAQPDRGRCAVSTPSHTGPLASDGRVPVARWELDANSELVAVWSLQNVAPAGGVTQAQVDESDPMGREGFAIHRSGDRRGARRLPDPR